MYPLQQGHPVLLGELGDGFLDFLHGAHRQDVNRPEQVFQKFSRGFKRAASRLVDEAFLSRNHLILMPLVTSPTLTTPGRPPSPLLPGEHAAMDSAERIMVTGRAGRRRGGLRDRHPHLQPQGLCHCLRDFAGPIRGRGNRPGHLSQGAPSARSKLREPEKFPAWLMTVTRNGARDRPDAAAVVPRRRRRPSTPSSMTRSPLPAPRWSWRNTRPISVARWPRLPEEHRTALTLRYLEGLDYRAIETEMGLSNGALRGILGRALGTLRRMPELERLSV